MDTLDADIHLGIRPTDLKTTTPVKARQPEMDSWIMVRTGEARLRIVGHVRRYDKDAVGPLAVGDLDVVICFLDEHVGWRKLTYTADCCRFPTKSLLATPALT
jgi:hypothetical protein